MRRSFIQPAGLFLMVVLVIPLVAARAQKRQPQWPNPAPLTPREKAIEVVRVINTAEYDYHTDHGRFGSWNEVYASGAFSASNPASSIRARSSTARKSSMTLARPSEQEIKGVRRKRPSQRTP